MTNSYFMINESADMKVRLLLVAGALPWLQLLMRMMMVVMMMMRIDGPESGMQIAISHILTLLSAMDMLQIAQA